MRKPWAIDIYADKSEKDALERLQTALRRELELSQQWGCRNAENAVKRLLMHCEAELEDIEVNS